MAARHGGFADAAVVAVAAVELVVVGAVVDVVDVVNVDVVVLVGLVLAVVVVGLPAAVAGVDGVVDPPALPQAASNIAAAATMIRRLRSFPFTPVRRAVPLSRANHGP